MLVKVNNVIFKKENGYWVSGSDKMLDSAFQRYISKANKVEYLDEQPKKRSKKVVLEDVSATKEEN